MSESVPSGVLGVPGKAMAEIALGRLIGANGNISRVYAIQDYPLLAIKYHANCGNLRSDSTDPILNEANFLRHLAGTRVANQLVYFSSGVRIGRTLLNRPEGKLSYIQPCDPRVDALDLPVVKYIITERVTFTLRDRLAVLPDQRTTFAEAMMYGKSLLRVVGRLHAANVVHGNIHPGNVGLISSEEKHARIVLIDFAQANTPQTDEVFSGAFSIDSLPTLLAADDLKCGLGFNSPWTSLHSRPNARDDAYQALQVIASMVFGYRHALSQSQVCNRGTPNSYKDYMRIKLHENLFDMNIEGNEFQLEHTLRDTQYEDHSAELTSALGEALTYVRTSTGSPSMDYIKRLLESVTA